MEDSRPGTAGPQEGSKQHDQAGSDQACTGEEKEGDLEERKAQRHRGRNAEKRSSPGGSWKKTAQRRVCWQSIVDGLCFSWGKRPR